MNIGEAARAAGLTAKTLRYYETVGLMPAAARRGSGYRDYGRREIDRLRFIARARGLGFSVEEVRRLLSLWDDRGRASAEVKRLALGHVGALDARIGELQSLRRTLAELAARCHGDDRPDCPILEDIAAGTAAACHDDPPAPRRRPAAPRKMPR